MTPLRILYAFYHLNPKAVGGGERLTQNLSSSLTDAGHHVRIATYSFGAGPFIDRGMTFRRYRYAGVPLVTCQRKLPLWKNLCLDGDPDFRRFAQEVLSRDRYDLIHSLSPMRTTSFILAAIKNRIPYVLTLTGHATLCYRDDWHNPKNEMYDGARHARSFWEVMRLPRPPRAQALRRAALAQRILSRAAAVVAPSLFMARSTQALHPGVRVQVIPHGVCRAGIRPNLRHYHRKSILTFGYMGNLMPIKGAHILIESFRKIKNPTCRLHIYGQNVDPPDYGLQLIRLAHGDKRIFFRGGFSTNEEVAKILQEIDVLCAPAVWFETYCYVVEEALGARVPVITSRVGATPERVLHGINGFTVRPADVDALYRIMDKLVKHPPQLNVLKNNTVSFTRLQEEAAQYESLYRNILNSAKNEL